MIPDTITTIGNSVIQHGPLNDRIYLMHLSEKDGFEILTALDEIIRKNGYTKIFAKVPVSRKEEFEGAGYHSEAYVPCFFRGAEGVHFMSKFTAPDRAEMNKKKEIGDILRKASENISNKKGAEMKDGFELAISEKSDSEELAFVFDSVFHTYPFPIHEPEYILETMEENVFYFHIVEKESGKIVSVSSADMDFHNKNVEMTDFATLPGYQGNGFASHLLRLMEDEMRKFGIKTAYTIARSLSYPMNRTFAGCGYTYAGNLVNNTHICGRLESMNVWYKPL